MLNESELKIWIHKDLKTLEKVLLVLATFEKPCAPAQIQKAALNVGFRAAKSWNVSLILTRSKGLAIRLPAGWEVAESGKILLRKLGVSQLSTAASQVANDLRLYLSKISNTEVKAFVEEAIACHEAQLHKSAIVMSWLAAVSVLQRYILNDSAHLASFNAEAKRIDPKWRAVITADDFGRMKESDFLDRLVAISLVGKNRKEALKRALDLRNGCGHPNSLQVSHNQTAAHIELLLGNVFDQYQV